MCVCVCVEKVQNKYSFFFSSKGTDHLRTCKSSGIENRARARLHHSLIVDVPAYRQMC